MAKSRKPTLLGLDRIRQGNIYPSLTPGPLGVNDGGDPLGWSWLGDTLGPLGLDDHGDPFLGQGLGGILPGQCVVRPPRPTREAPADAAADADAELLKAQENPDIVLLAAVAYGEASTGDVYEEMAAIASVIVRQRARGTTLQKLLGPGGTFAFAASDGNPRTAAFRKATPADRIKNAGMTSAIKAARNALDGGADFSNGAYFWDGADIKTNYANHPKVKAGITFTKPEHNIYKIKETSVDVTTHWQVKDKDGKLVDGKVRGHYTHVYESTAAYGGTIFWKYTDDYLKATGNKEYN